mgnify:CR=1 FL=1
MNDNDEQQREVAGVVKWFDGAKGFGFLTDPEGGADILLHANVLRNFGQSSVAEGARVRAMVQQTPRGVQAVEVLSIEPPAAEPMPAIADLCSATPEEVARLPLLPARTTLSFPGVTEDIALRIFTTALSTPFEVSGAAHVGGTVYLRIEGLEGQLAYRRDRLLALLADHRPEVLDDAPWQAIRDVAHFAGGGPLWRILCKPSDAPGLCDGLRAMGGDCSLDWGGGLIWYRGPGNPRALAPHATLVRREGAEGPAFPPLPPAVARLQDGLRRSFDPAGILNPGLMDA